MKIFLYSGTHWDREWYQCFQGFRHRLVELADQLVEGLETNGEYGIFHFDGQTVVLEDILEIAPDLEERLAKLIRAGKIVIGPWFCMPDEVNLSGESLILNLKFGREICRKWGVEPSADGYICDIFGHIAQMPQIFAGMGIEHTVLGRGTNDHTTPMHFRWQAPDGTCVTAYKLADRRGYADMECHFKGTGETRDERVESIRARIGDYVKERVGYANVPVVMFMDSCDHNPWNDVAPLYAEAFRRIIPGAEVRHANIMEMCAAVDEYRDALPVIAGEINAPTKKPGSYNHLITNTLSSRYPLKKANQQLETRLEKVIRPLYAYGIAGSREGFLKRAEKYLLLNHPHDSICGCSIDQVHRDMGYRFDQCRLITTEILDRVKRDMAAELSGEGKTLRVLNPLPYARKRMIECEIRFEKDWGKYAEPFGYENLCRFRIYDRRGRELPYGVTDLTTHADYDSYTVCFEAELAASGVTDFEIRPSETPTRYLERMPSTAASAENEWIAVSVNPDGSIRLTDKRTGRVYPALMQILDNGEIGDGWYHCAPAVDRTVTAMSCEVEKCADNVNQVSFRITRRLMLPKEMISDRFGFRRSEEYVEEKIVQTVTVYRTERWVSVKTTVDNAAKDHRMKLRLDTGIPGDRYHAGSAFAFVERRTGRDLSTADWKEADPVEKAMDGRLMKRVESGEDRGCGLAFLGKAGLLECAVTENGQMDVTLLRCYSRTVKTEGEPDGQLPGVHEFECLLLPLTAEDTPASVTRLHDEWKTELPTVTAAGGCAESVPGPELISDSFVFSTADKTETGYELRLYNCSGETGSGTLRLPGVRSAALTMIDGTPIEPLALTDGEIRLTLPPWRIATVRAER